MVISPDKDLKVDVLQVITYLGKSSYTENDKYSVVLLCSLIVHTQIQATVISQGSVQDSL